jgi:hypothetical protein
MSRAIAVTLRSRSHAERGRDACMVVMRPVGSGSAVSARSESWAKISAPLRGLIGFYQIVVTINSYVTVHKEKSRKQRYRNRNKIMKNGLNQILIIIITSWWWSFKYLWSYPTKEEGHNNIKMDSKKKWYD